MYNSKRKLICMILTCMILITLVPVTSRTTVFATTYDATVSGIDQQTVKGLGGGLPWYGVGTPISNYPLAAQTVLDMGTSVIRIYIHNIYSVFDSSGNLVNTTLANQLVSEIKWGADNGIPYNYSPGWNNLPRSCYSGGYLLQQYEQAACNAIKNMFAYFVSKGAPLPIMTTLANEPNGPVGEETTVPVDQLQRVQKLLRTTLNNAGYSSLKIGFSEAGEFMYANNYLGGNGWPNLGTDSTLNSSIGAFVTHSYYPNDTWIGGYLDGYNTYGNSRDSWMTEYCYAFDQVVTGKDYTTGTLERFISDMSWLKFNYWETWQLWNNNGPAAGDTLCSGNGTTTVTKPPAYYALKKIFTNVPPNSKVRKVTTTDTGLIDENSGFMDMIAFVSSSKMVAVFVNPTSTSRGTNVSGLTGSSASVYKIATGAAFNTDMTLISSPSISGGAISNVNLAANSVTVIVTNGGSGGGSTPTPTPTPGGNLLTNPGFETGSFALWDVLGTSSVQTTNTHSGTYSAKFASSFAGCYKAGVAVSPNTTYTLTVWGKAGASGNTGRLYVKNYGDDQLDVNFTSTDYEQKTITFTTGASNTTCEVGVNLTTTGTFYVDDFTLSH